MIQQLLWRADNERALPQLKMLLYIRFYYVMCRHMIKNVTPIVVAPRKRRRRRGRSWPIVRKYIQSRAQIMAILYLLAPTGALVLMMVYYISAAAAAQLFQILSIYAFLYCYKCHSKSLKQYQCN